MMQYTRWQKSLIKKSIRNRRILILSGPRQCGKTTLAQEADLLESTTYRTLDDLTLLKAAKNDPHAFVEHSKETMIIDEIQRVPDLLIAIKKVLDQNNRPGQFLLTGSSNINAIPSVQESLAGRIKNIRLRPLTQGEILAQKPRFLHNAFEQNFTNPKTSFSRQDIMNFALRGGFPEVLSLDPSNRQDWHNEYKKAVLNKDLQDIINIRRHDAMDDLFFSLASWSGKFMNLSQICTGLSIDRSTLGIYINALLALFLFERIPSWTKTDYNRIGKHPKIFMADSGLMASTLRWQNKDIHLDSDKIGKLFETFVFNELAAEIDHSNGLYYLYHYRDQEQREIDFLIERDDGTLLGIEVKAGYSLSQSSFKHLTWFKEYIAKDKPFIGIVLYTGEQTVSFGKNLWAVPISSLWS